METGCIEAIINSIWMAEKFPMRAGWIFWTDNLIRLETESVLLSTMMLGCPAVANKSGLSEEMLTTKSWKLLK